MRQVNTRLATERNNHKIFLEKDKINALPSQSFVTTLRYSNSHYRALVSLFLCNQVSLQPPSTKFNCSPSDFKLKTLGQD